jgi:threonine 3-dehydrogenase
MAERMKALVKAKPEPGIWMDEVPVPEPGPTEVLIKVRKTAICGTDVHIYNWDDWSKATIPVPMTIGHEFAGEIVAVGEEVEDFAPGDRVSGEGHIVCGHCRNCRAGREHLCRDTKGVGVNRPGAFAEYLVIPEHNAYKLPDDLSDEIGAILDPFGNAAHTALSFDLVGEDVLITGAGPIGIMAGAIAKKIGARHIVITDINPYRLKLAGELGLPHTVNVAERSLRDVMAELDMKEGFDVGLEMSGSPKALGDMIEPKM